MTKPERLRSINHSPPATGNKNDYDDSNFSNQSKYKKFTNFLKESNLINQQQQQQQQKIECNCWVCKILDSSSITDKTTTAQYEDYNIVSETGDSIFYDPILSTTTTNNNIFNNDEDKLLTNGEIYIAEDKFRDIVQDVELAKQFSGVNFNKNEY